MKLYVFEIDKYVFSVFVLLEMVAIMFIRN